MQITSSDSAAPDIMDWSVENTDKGLVLTGTVTDLKDAGELGLWIIGDSTRRYEIIPVDDPDAVSFTIPWDISENFQAEPAYLYIQHPGADGLMQVYPDNPMVVSAILYQDTVLDKRGVTLVRLKGSDASGTEEITENLSALITDPATIGMDDAWTVFYYESGSSRSFLTSEPMERSSRSASLGEEQNDEENIGEQTGPEEKPVENAPDRKAAEELNQRGYNLIEIGNYRDALPYFEQSAKADPHYLQAWNNIGACLNALRKYGDAVLAFDEAILIDPDFSEVWCNKGNALYNLKRYKEAVKAYEKALSLDPTNTDARIYKNKALAKLNPS